MAKRASNSIKKLMILSSISLVVGIGVIVAFIFVLANPIQTTSHGVGVGYTAIDVIADVEVYYKLGSNAESKIGELHFNYDTTPVTRQVDLDDAINLSRTDNEVIFKYKITNNGEAEFNVSIESLPVLNNMQIKYKVSSSGDAYTGDFSNTYLPVNLEYEDVKYIYISVSPLNANQSASLSGNFNFKLTKVEQS